MSFFLSVFMSFGLSLGSDVFLYVVRDVFSCLVMYSFRTLGIVCYIVIS